MPNNRQDDSDVIFEGIEMVPMGKRETNLHEAKLKVLGRSKVWKEEIGIGYEVAVMNSLGEYFVHKESADMLDEFFRTQNFAFAKVYIDKLNSERVRLLEEVAKDPDGDHVEGFSRLMGYFF